MTDLTLHAKAIRKTIVKMSYASGAGHITSSLSSTEILASLYLTPLLRYDAANPSWEKRDCFISSKGHIAMALYAVLARAGFFTQDELMTFCAKGSRLGGLTTTMVPGIECYSGSLGHGLPFAVGHAISCAIKGNDNLTFVLTGDGELQEGSIWESALQIIQFHLTNLIWIIDYNRIQLSGFIDNIISLDPLEDKLRAFGFSVKIIDGHDFQDLERTLTISRTNLPDKPTAIIARTVKGKGIPSLENKLNWHGRKPNAEELAIILKELDMTQEELVMP